MSGCGREALPDVRKCLGGPPVCRIVVGRPSLMSGSGREALPDVRVCLESLPDVPVCREALPYVGKLSGGPR